MSLKNFLRYGERAEIAAAAGCSPGQLSSIAHGKRAPSVALARRISVATEGRVTVKELLLGDEAPHLLERWSENDPMATPEQVAAWMLASQSAQDRGGASSPPADAPAPQSIHREASR